MRLLTGGQEEALINLMSWKKNSRKFAVAISPARTGVRGSGRGYAGFLSPIGDTLTTFVARNRYERAQVVACELPEKCGVRLHNTQHTRRSRKFATRKQRPSNTKDSPFE